VGGSSTRKLARVTPCHIRATDPDRWLAREVRRSTLCRTQAPNWKRERGATARDAVACHPLIRSPSSGRAGASSATALGGNAVVVLSTPECDCGDPTRCSEYPRFYGDRAHLVPFSVCNENKPDNIIPLCHNCHRINPEPSDPATGRRKCLDWLCQERDALHYQLRIIASAAAAIQTEAIGDFWRDGSVHPAILALANFPIHAPMHTKWPKKCCSGRSRFIDSRSSWHGDAGYPG
jgi:hypothetical protein